MTPKNLIFLLIIMLSSPVFAQNFNAKIILGLNGCQIDGDDMSGYNKAGLVAGAAVEYPLSKSLSIQPELIYSQKGSRFTEKDFTQVIWRINSIDIPVMLNYRFNEKVRGQFGVAVNYVISAKAADPELVFIDNTNLFSRFNYVSHIGVSYFASQEWEFNVRYGYSILNILKDVNGDRFSNLNRGYGLFHNFLSFTVNYNFKNGATYQEKPY